jgi:hypothetical protein
MSRRLLLKYGQWRGLIPQPKKTLAYCFIVCIIAPHDAGNCTATIKINKSLCGVPRGGFFRKSPLAAGGIFLFS